MRGAWRLTGADGEVALGAHGAARLLGALPVPAHVVALTPGRSWTWRVGPVDMDHEVLPASGGGCEVAVTLRAARPLEALLRATYAPVCAVLVRRLARIADADAISAD